MVTRWLLIDNSNTRTKFAIGGAAGMMEWKAIIGTRGIERASLGVLLGDLVFDAVVICSVVPRVAEVLLAHFKQVCPAVPVHVLDWRSPIGMEIDYPNPEQIGADRLANAAAIAECGPFPAVVIDFGTAVTFDVISSKPAYEGGVIAPGLGAMTDYLADRTALLPVVDLSIPQQAIGFSTEEAMRSGAYYGYRGLVRGILGALSKELKGAPRVIATGGDAAWIAQGMQEIHEVYEGLTLEGIRKVASRVYG